MRSHRLTFCFQMSNPWLSEVRRDTSTDSNGSLHGRPLDKDGKIIFEPFKRPGDCEFVHANRFLRPLICLQRK